MNCIIVDDEPMTRALMESLVLSTEALHLVKKCASAKEAMNIMLKEKVDLVFLDVEMPGMTGIQLMENINYKDVQVILITSKEEYAVKAFDFDVTDYIVKPISEERFLKAVMKAKKKHIGTANLHAAAAATAAADAADNDGDRDIFFKVKNARMVKINTKDILYVEALTNHVSIYSSGSERIIIHATLKSMEDKLPSSQFLRLHNSFIVRLDKITALEGNSVIINKTVIPVSRSNWKALTNRLEMI